MENPSRDPLLDNIEECCLVITGKVKGRPRVGIILGTGLGGVAERISVSETIPYGEIPHFPRSTVEGHAGRFLFGRLGGQDVAVMQGRVHPYEGYSPAQISLPVRVMKRLGVEVLVVSNAAGGLDPLFAPGDVMVISDHINLTGMNPLTGPNLECFGPRFPDMSAAYDRRLIQLAEEAAVDEKIPLRKGVYVGVAGPNLETLAETRFLRMIGADAVGMSTVLEVIAGVHCGLRILGLSAISNVNLPDCMKRIRMEEVLANAANAGGKLIWIVEGVLKRLRNAE